MDTVNQTFLIDGGPAFVRHGVSTPVLLHKYYDEGEWSPNLFSLEIIKDKEEFLNIRRGANCHALEFYFRNQKLTRELVANSGVTKIIIVGTVFSLHGDPHYEVLNLIPNAHVDKEWFYGFETADAILQSKELVAVLLTNQTLSIINLSDSDVVTVGHGTC